MLTRRRVEWFASGDRLTQPRIFMYNPLSRWLFGSNSRCLWVVCVLLTASSQAATKRAKPVTPLEPDFGLSQDKWGEMGAAVNEAISKKQIPGGVLWLERNGDHFSSAFGNRSLVPTVEPMTEDTIFDAASLTKVIATTPAIMLLVQRGRIELDSTAAKYWPEFGILGKERITIRQLLTHTSGLRPDLSLTTAWSGYEKALQLTCEEKLVTAPGEAFRYSDINFIVLGELVHRVSGMKLDQFIHLNLFKVLEMKDTEFNPTEKKRNRVAPTEQTKLGLLRGVVHDPTAQRMAGVAGHAGLFTTAANLAKFAKLMIDRGSHRGERIFNPETVQAMIEVQTPSHITARRGLGWDIDSPFAGPRGKHFPIGSYGHTGWTGTSLWIDPFSKTFIIFLSNRNHPTEEGSVVGLRNKLGTLAAEAVLNFNFSEVPGALPPRVEVAAKFKPTEPAWVEVFNGIDTLEKDYFKFLRGLKISLITNHTGKNRKRIPTIDLLAKAEGVQLLALFSPEHGIRGQMDEKVDDSKDEKTGLPVYSLYGNLRMPTTQQLAGLDALVFDIQDIGCRFYTYISTLGNCLEAANQHGLKVIVLDRVNPITGNAVEGPLLGGASSFTAYHSIPIRHGMTVGELAQMFVAERGWKTQLTVIPIQGWNRKLFYDATALPWINPSPNMRSLTEATLYPGIGLLETTALSVGRGTDTPFEIIGAPYMNDIDFAAEANRLGLPGVSFVPVQFTPKASVFANQLCSGVNLIILDRNQLRPVATGVALATLMHKMYPKEFGLEKFDRLLTHPKTIELIRNGAAWPEIEKSWNSDREEFLKRRSKYLLY